MRVQIDKLEIIVLKAHGGLHTLHSHMNQGRDPNVSVQHPVRRTTLPRTVIAKHDIEVGEGLVVMYVDPSLGVCETVRRSQLVAWGVGQCDRERSVEEEREGAAKMRVRVK